MEAVIMIDVLRRAGVDVCVASVEAGPAVSCSRSVGVVADCVLPDVKDRAFDLIAIPGGMPGAERLRDSADLRGVLAGHAGRETLVGAVCAAPQVVLQGLGLFSDREMTCHPGFMEGLQNPSEARVVVSGNCVTSRGPGTSFEFSLELVRELLGSEAAESVGGPMVLPDDGQEQLLCYGNNLVQPCESPRVLIPVASGTEEMEAVIMIDVLRRAGFEVTVASCEAQVDIVASRQVQIRADAMIGDVVSESFDAILLPGGMPGAERLAGCSALLGKLKSQRESGKLYGAICASPAVVLQPNGLIGEGQVATCHPGFMEGLQNPSEARVVVSGNCLTSRGPGTSFEFALACVALLSGQKSRVVDVATPMLLPDNFNPDRLGDKLGIK
ncbi:class I glutamine amidotransferase [Chloropicon primus]|nr:class I glutamine amidotransferase [Chloropicon primus]